MRTPILLCATGTQGVGKSYKTLQLALYQAYIAKHRRSSLLFDTNAEYASYVVDGVTHKIQTINHNEIIKYGNQNITQVRRIVPFHPNGAPMGPEDVEKLLLRCLEEYRNGTLIIEDLNRIYADALPKQLSGALVNVRHRNCDVVFHMQSIGRMLPKMRQNTKIIRYHSQLDSILESADKLGNDAEVFYICEKMVQKQYDSGNIRFFVYVYREIKKVKGQFSPKMFAEAIAEYISQNPRAIGDLVRQRTADGKKMYSYQEALRLRTFELFKKYYGNDNMPKTM